MSQAISENREPSMLTEQFQRMNDAGTLTPALFARATFLAKSTAYNYFNGDSELRCVQLNQVLRALTPQAGAELLAVVLSGTGHATVYMDPVLDVNGDGDIDSRDVMHRVLAAIRMLSEQAQAVNDGKPIDPEVFATSCQEVIEGAEAAKRCVYHIAEMRRTRRKARPFTRGINGKAVHRE